MAVRYIAGKTTRLYEANQGSSRSMVLIFGDEIETTGPPTNGRVPVLFRGRGGWVEAGDLSSQAPLEIY